MNDVGWSNSLFIFNSSESPIMGQKRPNRPTSLLPAYPLAYCSSWRLSLAASHILLKRRTVCWVEQWSQVWRTWKSWCLIWRLNSWWLSYKPLSFSSSFSWDLIFPGWVQSFWPSRLRFLLQLLECRWVTNVSYWIYYIDINTIFSLICIALRRFSWRSGLWRGKECYDRRDCSHFAELLTIRRNVANWEWALEKTKSRYLFVHKNFMLNCCCPFL